MLLIESLEGDSINMCVKEGRIQRIRRWRTGTPPLSANTDGECDDTLFPVGSLPAFCTCNVLAESLEYETNERREEGQTVQSPFLPSVSPRFTYEAR